jgi:glycosyltransferase involved in cell wall biosynthesis
MKILYEASNLGLGHIDSKSRAGIFRYVESVLEQLTINPDIDIAITTTTNFYNCIFTKNYLESEKPEWRERFLNSYTGRIGSADYYLTVLNNIHKNEARDIFNKAKRKLQSLFIDFLAKSSKPSDINDSFDIYHSFYHPFSQKHKINSTHRVITIHDMIPLLMPRYFNQGFEHQFFKIINMIDVNSDWAIAVSESTKKDFCYFSKMPEDRVFVTPLAANSKFYQEMELNKIESAYQKYKIPVGKYILGLSTLEPRKNTAFLIECFYKILLENKLQDIYLILVGAKGWLFKEIFDMAETQPDLLENIIFTGYIQDSDLSAIYSGATCFVYPSFYEGFGLPPLEAMQCGVPVITSNTSSLPEVVGDAGILIDPKDKDQLCQAMLNVLNDETLRENLKQKSLERAKQFSWEKCANETVEIYKKIIASK